MARTAEVHLVTGWIYTIITDIPKNQAVDVAPEFDDYRFPFYFEADGRTSWVYQHFGSWEGLDTDIESLKRNKKPTVREIFDAVEIIDEETGEIYNTLYYVDLFGILEGIREVVRNYKETK